MFEKDYYTGLSLTHPFGEKRGYGRHVGRDFLSYEFKGQRYYANIDGVIHDVDKHNIHGTYVVIKHNPKYAGLVDDILYSRYKHMSSVRADIIKDHLEGIDQFIEHGNVIGNFGNSGYCKTKDNGVWRFLTEHEKADTKETRAVHGHEEYFQPCKKGEMTPLFAELLRLFPDIMIENIAFIYQWGRVYYEPELIFKYFKKGK